jgi:hypothetical protein
MPNPFHVSQDVCSLYGACPSVSHNIGHRFQPGPIVDQRSRGSALRFLPRHKVFHQFLDRQIPVFDNFLFLKALPRFVSNMNFSACSFVSKNRRQSFLFSDNLAGTQTR